MTPILPRIKKIYGLDISKPELIASILSKWSSDERVDLVKQHDIIAFEYRVHCAKLINDFNDSTVTEETKKQQTLDADCLATLLLHLNKDYLNVQREVDRLTQDKIIRAQLFKKDEEKDKQAISIHTKSYFSKSIRDTTGSTNVMRLFTTRLRRLLLALTLFNNTLSTYNQFILLLNKYATPFLLYLGWAFFIPRLFGNLFFTLKHLLPYNMSPEEKSLGWKTRLSIQWAARWPELGNDITWFIVGLLNCFVLVGPLMPVVVFVSFGLQICDVVLAAMRLYIDVKKYTDLKKEYQLLIKGGKLEKDVHTHTQSMVEHFNQHIAYEANRLTVILCSASMILVSLIFMIPVLAASPVLLLIGGIIATTTSFMAVGSLKYIESTKPKMDMSALLNQSTGPGFFNNKKDTSPANNALPKVKSPARGLRNNASPH